MPCFGGGSISLNADLDLSAKEILALTDKASKGDGNAAWRLYNCYSFARSDEKSADIWLCRAAELKNTSAERLLAEAIRERDHSPGSFGATKPEAFYKLLEQASYTDGQACYDLASAYADGYPGAPDYAKARYYYARGSELANRMCWEKLSQLCHKGWGGARDEICAYYWISLETRCVDPRSIGGKEEWAEREEIAQRLTLEELKPLWERIDQYIAKV